DGSSLTVLNLTDPTPPRTAKDALRNVASRHPEYFPAAQQGGQFVLEKNVRMGPDGVFVASQKVADLGQLVENIARHDVAEIRLASVGARTPGFFPQCTALGVVSGRF